jgi:hypothetical protein
MVLDEISATTQKECAMLAFLYEKNVVHVPAGSKRFQKEMTLCNPSS